MLEIKQKRIRSLKRHLSDELVGKELVFLVQSNELLNEKIKKAGFILPLKNGDTVLPTVIGSITRFNANGKEIPLKDEPKETKYRDFEFTRQEWHGQETVDVTSIVWIPYQRYQRKTLPSPAVELTIVVNEAGQHLITTPPIIFKEKNYTNILHCINLLLELFNECIIMESDNGKFQPVKRQKLNWELLPKGEQPWEVIEEYVRKKRLKQPEKTYAASLDRFKKINSLKPDFHATGNGGYTGYVAFGFTDLNIYVLESQYHNNATYVFGQDWESLTQLTKAEILFGNLHKKRLVHSKTWFKELSTYINSLRKKK